MRVCARLCLLCPYKTCEWTALCPSLCTSAILLSLDLIFRAGMRAGAHPDVPDSFEDMHHQHHAQSLHSKGHLHTDRPRRRASRVRRILDKRTGKGGSFCGGPSCSALFCPNCLFPPAHNGHLRAARTYKLGCGRTRAWI